MRYCEKYSRKSWENGKSGKMKKRVKSVSLPRLYPLSILSQSAFQYYTSKLKMAAQKNKFPTQKNIKGCAEK
jgi:hypothetical protein